MLLNGFLSLDFKTSSYILYTYAKSYKTIVLYVWNL